VHRANVKKRGVERKGEKKPLGMGAVRRANRSLKVHCIETTTRHTHTQTRRRSRQLKRKNWKKKIGKENTLELTECDVWIVFWEFTTLKLPHATHTYRSHDTANKKGKKKKREKTLELTYCAVWRMPFGSTAAKLPDDTHECRSNGGKQLWKNKGEKTNRGGKKKERKP